MTGWHRHDVRAALREALVIKPMRPFKPNTVKLVRQCCNLGLCHVRVGGSRSRIGG